MAVTEVAMEAAMEAVAGTTEVDVTGASALLDAAPAPHHAVETTMIAREAHATAITNEVDLDGTTAMIDAASAHAAQRQTATEATAIAI